MKKKIAEDYEQMFTFIKIRTTSTLSFVSNKNNAVFLMQLRIPLQYWPTALHLLTVSLLATGLLVMSVLGLRWLETYHHQTSEELSKQIHQQQTTNQRGAATSTDLFHKRLPSVHVTEQLNRDITDLAAEKHIRLNSLQIEKRLGTSTTHSSVIYRVSAEAPYIDTKKWLSELLAKYDTLGIREVSIAEETNEASMRSLDITLVLYVQN